MHALFAVTPQAAASWQPGPDAADGLASLLLCCKPWRGSLSETHVQVQELEQQRQVLVRNISCLYNTAVEENKRKDALIRELRMEQFQAAAAKAKGLQS